MYWNEQAAQGPPGHQRFEILEGGRVLPYAFDPLFRKQPRLRGEARDVSIAERQFERAVALVNDVVAAVGAKSIDEAVVQFEAARTEIAQLFFMTFDVRTKD